jgi:hypothetical protein
VPAPLHDRIHDPALAFAMRSVVGGWTEDCLPHDDEASCGGITHRDAGSRCAWRSRQPSLSEGPKIRLARWNGGAMKSLRVCRVTAYPQDFGSLWWANRQSVQLRDGTYMPNLDCER